MKPRFIYNDDSCTLRTTPQPHSLQSISAALDYLKGTQVDCLSWCLGEQLAYSWPSEVIENYFDLVAEGARVTPGFHCGRDVMVSLHRRGIDYLPLLIQGAHAQGLSFIGSFRLNDTHIKSSPNGALAPRFWKTRQHCRLWEVTDGKGYYNAALDYSQDEVRSHYRDSIAEVVERYALDGIELDFTRSPYFFQPSEAWSKREILTDFVREIRELLEQAGAKRNRQLTLLVRIPARECILAQAGIDAHHWIEEKLAPIFVVSELANDYNQCLEDWVALCRSAGVLLYPAVEAAPAFNRTDFYSTQPRNPLAPRHDNGDAARFTMETELAMQRAAAQNLLAQHPDGLYLFNFACRLAEGANIMHTDPAACERLRSTLCEMGSLETLAGRAKHYTFFPELPIYVEAGRPRRFHQTIPFHLRGEDIRDATVTLRFHQVAERNPHASGRYHQSPVVRPGLLHYFVNDSRVCESDLKRSPEPAGRLASGYRLRKHEVIELTLPGHQLLRGKNLLAFEMPSHLPRERAPYVYIYDLEATASFSS